MTKITQAIIIIAFVASFVSVAVFGLNKQSEAFCNENPRDKACIEWSNYK